MASSFANTEVVIFSFLKGKKAAPELPPARVAPTPTECVAPTPSTKTDAERIVDSVNEFRNQMKGLASRTNSAHKASLEDAKKKIAYADGVVRQAGLDKAMLLILKETWHWSTWSQREDMANLGKNFGIGIVESEVRNDDGDETKTLTFRYDGAEYVLKFIKKQSYVDLENTFGSIRLSTSAGETLLSIAVMHTLNREYDDWRYVSVDGLTLGLWVGHVVEIEEKMKARNQERLRGYEAKSVLDQASGLPPLEK